MIAAQSGAHGNQQHDFPPTFEEAIELAEQGVLIPYEDLSNQCSTEEEIEKLRLKYPFLARIARSNVLRTGQDAQRQTTISVFAVRTICVALAITLLATVAAICYLAVVGQAVPDILISVVSALVGYLVGIVTGALGLRNSNRSSGGS